MYTAEDIGKLGGHEFAELLEPLSRRDLRDILIYLAGYSPEGMARALNFSVRADADVADRLTGAGRAAAEPITDSERDLPKVYVSPCNDEPGHEPCSGITGLCDCDCHAFVASVMAAGR